MSSDSSSSLSPDQLLAAAAKCIPPLGAGVSTAGGCVAVVGGSAGSSGPVCLAAMAALRAGAESVHVVCAPAAAPAIRTFSPELVVFPALHGGEAGGGACGDGGSRGLREFLAAYMPTWQAVLVGPGLFSECSRCVEDAALVIEMTISLNRPLVIDADGLSLVADRPELVRGCPRVLLTPSDAEFVRLHVGLLGCPPPPPDGTAPARKLAARLAAALAGPCVLLKGREDAVAVAAGFGQQQQLQAEACGLQGCGRRCAGQGAVLAGLALVFSHWSFTAAADPAVRLPRHPALLAAYAASALTRRCGAQAFALRRRATLASDSLEQVGSAFSRLFPEADCAR